MDKTIIQSEIKWHEENVVGSWEPMEIQARELNKYRTCKDWKSNPKQRLFKEMGDLHGKVALDFGSGQGINGVQMALLGAEVRGFDLSPHLVKQSNRLADLNHVADKCRFIVGEATTEEFPPNCYDIVLIDLVLHHIPRESLARVLGRVKNTIKPDGKILIREPVALSNMYQKFRGYIPIKEAISPNERELRHEDLKIIFDTLINYDISYYGFFDRIAKHIGIGKLRDWAMKLDRLLFNIIKPFRNFAGIVVIIAGKN